MCLGVAFCGDDAQKRTVRVTNNLVTIAVTSTPFSEYFVLKICKLLVSQPLLPTENQMLSVQKLYRVMLYC